MVFLYRLMGLDQMPADDLMQVARALHGVTGAPVCTGAHEAPGRRRANHGSPAG